MSKKKTVIEQMDRYVAAVIETVPLQHCAVSFPLKAICAIVAGACDCGVVPQHPTSYFAPIYNVNCPNLDEATKKKQVRQHAFRDIKNKRTRPSFG